MNYLYLAIAIVCEVIATSALKATPGLRPGLPLLMVVCGYGAAFFFLSLTLRTMNIGVVYALWSGLGIVLISIAGAVFYRQTLDTAALIGLGLIVAGVVVLNVFSKSVMH